LQHHPCRRVSRQSQQPLESHRADAYFLVCHPPNGSIPESQRDFAPMEDGTCCDRYDRLTGPAVEQSSFGAPCRTSLAFGTNESCRPTNPFEVASA
jgi:hypothetical protein